MMRKSSRSRRGFTLVEMMVSVALVCLMLALFGEVFSIATKSMSKMKGVAENDQKARMLNVILRGDIRTRTFRQVPGEFGIHALQGYVDPHISLAPASFDDSKDNTFVSSYQRGYIYISENNPNDGTDDIIQLTIDTSRASNNFETPTLYGRALHLGTNTNPYNPPNDTTATDLLQHNPNQPVFDDQAGRYTTGVLTSDQTGSSSYAEVAYFLRNGSLYRRQLLIRDPVDRTVPDNQPRRSDAAKTLLIPSNTAYGSAMVWNPVTPAGTDRLLSTGSFWGDFDYSATWDASSGLRFNGTLGSNAFDNSCANPATAAGTSPDSAKSLGFPSWRFGFIPSSAALAGGIGAANHSMEYASHQDSNGNINYLGRFTQQETSASNFAWPGVAPGDGSTNDNNPMTSQFIYVPYNNPGMTDGVATINGTQYFGTRVSQDLLMPNVHEFDIKVWDDWAVNPITGLQGMFVDIGGANAAKYATSSNQAYGSNNPNGFRANVYDTWHPALFNGGVLSAPFRNHDFGADGQPGVAGVDDNKNGIIDQNDYLKDAFGNPILNASGNKIFLEQGAPASDDWHDMKAIQVHIRYYDTPSNSMRDLTIIESFVE